MNHRIAILFGGTSAERSVSLVSGQSLADVLSTLYPGQVDLFDLQGEHLPEGLDPARHVVFPVLHGGFGEGGGLQELLEHYGFTFAGCDSASARLCLHKQATKDRVAQTGVRTIPGLCWRPPERLDPRTVIARIGSSLVAKPACEGSSVGLQFLEGAENIEKFFQQQFSGEWMLEKRIRGRELTVGLLCGRALGVVEIVPSGGVYDYQHKYTPGLTQYRVPAPLAPAQERQVKHAAEQAFYACGCRDFARIDFLFTEDGPWFLEINTIPGLTSTSLLPKSASCAGYDFPRLARAMLEPALQRHSTLALAC